MEANERPKAYEELGRQIQKYMKIIEAYKAKVTCQHNHVNKKIWFMDYLFVSINIWFWFHQDEQYDHLDELEVTRIDKQVNEAMTWMNSKMNQQNSQDLTLDPVVRVGEIQAKAKVP